MTQINNILINKKETVEQAAVDYISESSARAREHGMVYSAIIFGSNWQKEKDMEMIEELLRILKLKYRL